MSSPEIVILADDLSGAADSAVQLVHAGMKAEVLLEGGIEGSPAQVVAVDADTRALSADEAAERMYRLASMWIRERPSVLFKKVDSTLRGHVAAEIAAALRGVRGVHPAAVAVFAPALPASGRTTLQGMHLLHGRPLHETEMWTHERMGGEAHIPRSLQRAGLRCRHLGLDELRRGWGVAVSSLRSTDVVVCDAVTEADLAVVAALAAGLGPSVLWVGSAGLASCLVHADEARSAVHANELVGMPARPALFVVGSVGGRAREQAEALLAGSGVRSFVAAPDVLLGGRSDPRWTMLVDGLRAALVQGDDALLMSGSQPTVDPTHRSRLSFALGEMTEGLRGHVGTLVACGGETARRVLDGWGVQVLRLRGELESGVPVSQAMLPNGRELNVITKAGDFGQRETLLNCLRCIHDSKRGQ